MRDLPGLPRGSILGYCTNVHAGNTPADLLRILSEQVPAVHDRVAPDDEMGIGLWMSQDSARFFFEHSIVQEKLPLGQGMHRRGLVPFTINGFPLGDFHSDVVKHRVYEPDWSHEDRWGYTIIFAKFHTHFLDDDHAVERSISTLPIGWNGPPCPPVNRDAAADRLLNIVKMLNEWYQNSGLVIHLDLEPEPGCILQRSSDVVEYFQSHLLTRAAQNQVTDEQLRRHIRVCHDICHAAVMFEDQREMFEKYRAAGIKIGKVQISNAIRVPFDEYSESNRREALRQLSAFAEDRYLHQTMIRFDDGTMQFFEDLPLAIQSVPANQTARGEWRVHFHVPVYLESFGLLKTTRDHIIECMKLLQDSDVHHWEVETYAWDVLPAELKMADLADGIAKELLWVKDQAAKLT